MVDITPWRDVDRADARDSLLAFLDELADVSVIRQAKRRSLELLALKPGDRVLDACCGTGVDLVDLAELVAPDGEVTGLDLSEAALVQARARASGADQIRIVKADVSDLPFPSDCFDAARIDRGLLHAADPELAVAELSRVTRPGGTVVITEARVAGGEPAGLDVLPFLPYLMMRAGLERVQIDHDRQPVRLSATLRAALDALCNEVTVRIVHAVGVVGPRGPA